MTEQQNYEPIAKEYYNPEHETCRFFEDLTENYFRTHSELVYRIPGGGKTLDAGSGAGLSERYLGSKHSDLTVHLDLSPSMLEQADGSRVQANAVNLPFREESFDKVTSFLFDAFYSLDYFKEVSRVLSNTGMFIATLPSNYWASKYREAAGHNQNTARFKTADAGDVFVPSHTPPAGELFEEVFQNAGFKALELHTITAVGAEDIPQTIAIAAKATDSPLPQQGVLTLIIASKNEPGKAPVESSFFDPLQNQELVSSAINYHFSNH